MGRERPLGRQGGTLLLGELSLLLPALRQSPEAGAASRPDSAPLAQDTESVADVVVWGTLFPVLRDETSLPSKSETGVPRESIPRVPMAVGITLCARALSLSVPPHPQS